MINNTLPSTHYDQETGLLPFWNAIPLAGKDGTLMASVDHQAPVRALTEPRLPRY